MTIRNIFVELDTAANPAVILTDSAGNSARGVQAVAGDTIRWQKRDNDDNFDIMDLEPTGTGEAFGDYSTGGSGQWLESEYQPTNTNPFASFAYTLEVETPDNDPYDTTEKGASPTNDRPVIRN